MAFFSAVLIVSSLVVTTRATSTPATAIATGATGSTGSLYLFLSYEEGLCCTRLNCGGEGSVARLRQGEARCVWTEESDHLGERNASAVTLHRTSTPEVDRAIAKTKSTTRTDNDRFGPLQEGYGAYDDDGFLDDGFSETIVFYQQACGDLPPRFFVERSAFYLFMATFATWCFSMCLFCCC
ncbi:ORF9 [Barthadenovirus mellis]|uniref:ORF9 n=1 Tax=Passerine adenovirus 1 TaxID=2779174 RepID=A0A7L9DIZ7_9ADEN|nr:ORF9 [Passerine adenovirus 1]